MSQTQTGIVKATPVRYVNVVSTQGTPVTQIEVPEEILWEDLKKILVNTGYRLEGLKAVESTQSHTLEHPKAFVPSGNFSLFLMPIKSKSGASPIRASVKSLIAKHGQHAKDHFNAGGNWTRTSNEDLQKLLDSYKEPEQSNESSKEKKKEKFVKEAKKPHVQKPKEDKKEEQKQDTNLAKGVGRTEDVDTSKLVTSLKTTSDPISLIGHVIDALVIIGNTLRTSGISIPVTKATLKEEVKQIQEEKLEKPPLNADDLRKQLNELGKGFSDVRL